MNNQLRILVIVIVSVLIVAAATAAFLTSAPRVEMSAPAPGSLDVPAGSPVRLAFSCAMQTESVIERISFEPERSGSFTWEGNTLIFTPDRFWPSGERVTVSIRAGARRAGWLGQPLLRSARWDFVIGQTLLAYLWPANNSADIYGLDPLTGDVRRFTEMGNVLDFSLNKDGSMILFSARNNQGGSNLFTLERAQAGSSPQTIIEPLLLIDCQEDACRNPQLSADGKLLAFESMPLKIQPGQPQVQVWLYDLAASQIKPAGAADHSTRMPGWSANNWLAFYDDTEQGFVLYEPAQEQRLWLPNQTGVAGSWQPQGTSFVVPEILVETVGQLEERTYSHLFRYDLATSHEGSIAPVDLTREANLEDAVPVYSPDGKSIAFARKYVYHELWTPGRQLWIMQVDGSQPTQLTHEPFYNYHDFSWSTDGRQIAIVRSNMNNFTDPPELWLMNANGSNAIQLVIGGYAPEWMP